MSCWWVHGGSVSHLPGELQQVLSKPLRAWRCLWGRTAWAACPHGCIAPQQGEDEWGVPSQRLLDHSEVIAPAWMALPGSVFDMGIRINLHGMVVETFWWTLFSGPCYCCVWHFSITASLTDPPVPLKLTTWAVKSLWEVMHRCCSLTRLFESWISIYLHFFSNR